jgi:hypothetical protein
MSIYEDLARKADETEREFYARLRRFVGEHVAEDTAAIEDALHRYARSGNGSLGQLEQDVAAIAAKHEEAAAAPAPEDVAVPI